MPPTRRAMGLEYIQFANGDQWGRDTIAGIAASTSPFIAGTNGNDTLVGSAVAQNIYGEAGNDTLDGQGGNDLLYGGLGDDRLIVSVSSAGDLATVDGGVGRTPSTCRVLAWLCGSISSPMAPKCARPTKSDLNSGTWRDVADVARVENVHGPLGHSPTRYRANAGQQRSGGRRRRRPFLTAAPVTTSFWPAWAAIP